MEPTQLPSHQRRTSRKPLIAALAGCLVLVLVVAGGLYWWQAPITIQSTNGVIKADVPRDWVDDSTPSHVDEPGLSDLLSDGPILELRSRTDAGFKNESVTVAASRYGNIDPADPNTYGRPADWPAKNCFDEDEVLENQYPKTDKYDSGMTYTYRGKCVGKHHYGDAVLLAHDKGKDSDVDYWVRVLLVGDDPGDFESVIDSIEIDADRLPE